MRPPRRAARAPALAPLGLALLLLLTASMAGCFERRGTLAIDLVVSEAGAVGEFSRINLSLAKVRIDARTLNPEDTTSRVERLEVVSAARSGEAFRVFEGEVRADKYDRITIITPPGGTFQGQLRDGTPVAVVVPNGALSQTTTFEVARGGAITFTFTIGVVKNDSGQGLPTYSLVALAEESGAR